MPKTIMTIAAQSNKRKIPSVVLFKPHSGVFEELSSELHNHDNDFVTVPRTITTTGGSTKNSGSKKKHISLLANFLRNSSSTGKTTLTDSTNSRFMERLETGVAFLEEEVYDEAAEKELRMKAYLCKLQQQRREDVSKEVTSDRPQSLMFPLPPSLRTLLYGRKQLFDEMIEEKLKEDSRTIAPMMDAVTDESDQMERHEPAAGVDDDDDDEEEEEPIGPLRRILSSGSNLLTNVLQIQSETKNDSARSTSSNTALHWHENLAAFAVNLFVSPAEKRRKDEEDTRQNYEQGEDYFEKEQWNYALRYYNRVLAQQRELFGKDSLLAARTLNRIGITLMNMDEAYGALTALEEALFIRTKMLGEQHPESVSTNECIERLMEEQQCTETGMLQSNVAMRESETACTLLNSVMQQMEDEATKAEQLDAAAAAAAMKNATDNADDDIVLVHPIF